MMCVSICIIYKVYLFLQTLQNISVGVFGERDIACNTVRDTKPFLFYILNKRKIYIYIVVLLVIYIHI